jgi:hypothetical protein
MSIARRGLRSCRQRRWPQRPPSTAILLIQLVSILQLLRPSNVVVHGLQLGISAKRRPVSRILPNPHGVVTVPLRQTSLYPRCLESSSPTTLYYRNDATVHNDTLLIDPCDNLITTLDHPWNGGTILIATSAVTASRNTAVMETTLETDPYPHNHPLPDDDDSPPIPRHWFRPDHTDTDWHRTDWVVRILGRRVRINDESTTATTTTTTTATLEAMLRLLVVHAASAFWWESVVRGHVVYSWIEMTPTEPATAVVGIIVLVLQAWWYALAMVQHATSDKHDWWSHQNGSGGHFLWGLLSAGWMVVVSNGDWTWSLLLRAAWQSHVSWRLWHNVNDQWDWVHDTMTSTSSSSSSSSRRTDSNSRTDTTHSHAASSRLDSTESAHSTTTTSGWWPPLSKATSSQSITALNALSNGRSGEPLATTMTTGSTATNTHPLSPDAEKVTRRFFAAMDSQHCGSLTLYDVQRAISYIQASSQSRLSRPGPGVHNLVPMTDRVHEQFGLRATPPMTRMDTTATEPPIHWSEPRLAYDDFVELLHALRPYL